MKKTMPFLLSLIILVGAMSLCSCTDDVPLPPPPVTTVGEGVGTDDPNLPDYLRDGTDQVIENGWLGFLTDGAYIACIGSPLTFRGLYAKINLEMIHEVFEYIKTDSNNNLLISQVKIYI